MKSSTGVYYGEPSHISVFDLETSFKDVKTDVIGDVYSISLQKRHPTTGKLLKGTKTWFINPVDTVPNAKGELPSFEIHGIDTAKLKANRAVDAKTALAEISKEIEGSVLAGFNSKSYDTPALRRFYEKVGVAFPEVFEKEYDVMKVMHDKLGKPISDTRRSLGWVFEQVYGAEERALYSAHVGEDDVRMTGRLLEHIFDWGADKNPFLLEHNSLTRKIYQEATEKAMSKGAKGALIAIGVGAAYVAGTTLFGEHAGRPASNLGYEDNRIEGLHAGAGKLSQWSGGFDDFGSGSLGTKAVSFLKGVPKALKKGVAGALVLGSVVAGTPGGLARNVESTFFKSFNAPRHITQSFVTSDAAFKYSARPGNLIENLNVNTSEALLDRISTSVPAPAYADQKYIGIVESHAIGKTHPQYRGKFFFEKPGQKKGAHGADKYVILPMPRVAKAIQSSAIEAGYKKENISVVSASCHPEWNLSGERTEGIYSSIRPGKFTSGGNTFPVPMFPQTAEIVSDIITGNVNNASSFTSNRSVDFLNVLEGKRNAPSLGWYPKGGSPDLAGTFKALELMSRDKQLIVTNTPSKRIFTPEGGRSPLTDPLSDATGFGAGLGLLGISLLRRRRDFGSLVTFAGQGINEVASKVNQSTQAVSSRVAGATRNIVHDARQLTGKAGKSVKTQVSNISLGLDSFANRTNKNIGSFFSRISRNISSSYSSVLSNIKRTAKQSLQNGQFFIQSVSDQMAFGGRPRVPVVNPLEILTPSKRTRTFRPSAAARRRVGLDKAPVVDNMNAWDTTPAGTSRTWQLDRVAKGRRRGNPMVPAAPPSPARRPGGEYAKGGRKKAGRQIEAPTPVQQQVKANKPVAPINTPPPPAPKQRVQANKPIIQTPSTPPPKPKTPRVKTTNQKQRANQPVTQVTPPGQTAQVTPADAATAQGGSDAWLWILGAGALAFGSMGSKTQGSPKEWSSPWHGPTVSGPLSQQMVQNKRLGFQEQRGPHPNDPHPELSPPTPKDDLRLNKLAASKIGLSYWEMYDYMTKPDKGVSEYVQASAAAGTALHRYMEATQYAEGTAAQAEVLAMDKVMGIGGYIDVISPSGAIGDIKTLSGGRYKAVKERGWAYPSHEAQIRQYMAMTGSIDQSGFVQYINRDNLDESFTYEVPWSSSKHYKDIKTLQAARRRVWEDIDSGKLDKSQLPQASSIESMEREYAKVEGDVQNWVGKRDEMYQTYLDEMEWLNSTRRNMPDQLAKNNKKHYSHDSVSYKHKDRSWMGQTVGLSQHLHENANQHHVY